MDLEKFFSELSEESYCYLIDNRFSRHSMNLYILNFPEKLKALLGWGGTDLPPVEGEITKEDASYLLQAMHYTPNFMEILFKRAFEDLAWTFNLTTKIHKEFRRNGEVVGYNVSTLYNKNINISEYRFKEFLLNTLGESLSIERGTFTANVMNTFDNRVKLYCNYDKVEIIEIGDDVNLFGTIDYIKKNN